jgi:chromosome partitioning protein
MALAETKGRELALKNLLQRVRQRYELIILDCPPSLSLIAVNALVAADAVIVPVWPQFLAAQGLIGLLTSLDTVRTRLGTKGQLLGILLTMVDPKRPCSAVRERLHTQFGPAIFETEILRSRELEEAPARGRTIFEHAPRSRAAAAYRCFAREVLHRLRRLHG